jgi:predicted phage tail protein
MNAGIAMAIGGVVQMLTPLPKSPNQEDRPDNKPSYIFNGAVNTTAQGYPVPVGYGRMIVGSAVISAGITTDEVPV